MSVTDTAPPTPKTSAEPGGPGRWREAFATIIQGNWLLGLLAILVAILFGSILVAATNEGVQAAAGYFFARPGDTLAAIWESVSGAYTTFFRGAVYNFSKPDFAAGIRPLTETLHNATPLIAAGLGVALTFRTGLFNIGGRGQMLFGAAVGGWVGFALPMPIVVHPLVAIVLGMAAGAIWGGIAGVLKAVTGAHEVITTIMLNYIAYYLVQWLLATPGLLQKPGTSNPISPAELPSAVLPKLFGYNLTAGFFISLAAVAAVWFLLERSTLGFKLRAVGENPFAARTAGIDPKRTIVIAMALSGALLGLAGVQQALGTITTGVTSGIDAGLGFDAITVALLGRSRPVGVLFAAILFGAFKAGGYAMQAGEGIPIDIVTVVQALIVLFLAAPPLIRAMFHLPQPGARRDRRKSKLRNREITEVTA